MNNGTLLDLPDNVGIERNVIVDGNGAYPISVGHLPVNRQIQNKEYSGILLQQNF
ncbi:hypothetical protein K2F40_08990 [Clostridium sp. CM028]|nr:MULTISPECIES: hypothetical protein [unclassified Clostridium]MBW9146658.1 hypothetical protein [Clostridium sp. CM027]MBW9149094.1 hypothetical protein [Clostridium sp. CM028]UVE42021.1 hypothetical protein KTC92_06080 [Clostridium sp. CM027]WLC62641.1 hypothetical protein KTC94_05060 [Clostridium sp. CM028]